jgi:hypothetical protein
MGMKTCIPWMELFANEQHNLAFGVLGVCKVERLSFNNYPITIWKDMMYYHTMAWAGHGYPLYCLDYFTIHMSAYMI